MRVDAHVTLWAAADENVRAHPAYPGDERAYLPADLVPILQRNRFDAALLVAPNRAPGTLQQLVEWMRSHPMLAGILAPWDADVSPVQDVVRGLTLHAPNALPAALPRALQQAAAHSLPLDLIPPFGDATAHASSAETLARFPHVPVVLCHTAGPPDDPHQMARWIESLQTLAALPHVHCKLSGMWSTSISAWDPAAKNALFAHLLKLFSPQRLLFGSDWPFSLPAHSWKECLAAFTQSLGAQPMDLREQVLGDTAARIYRLTVDE